ncbi:ATP-binding cassette domain-containing protein [Candidatus Dojkabacteria bacterium]|nr:ATP-binding cassette domain-containing protein [Candidatus Dojkabacteria bacterium]
MLQIKNVSKQYPGNIFALSNISFNVDSGELCYLIGHSGAGKSTLVKLILREESPTEGAIQFNDVLVSELPDDYIQAYRQQIGIVFQDYKLIKTKTAIENIIFAMEVTGRDGSEIKSKGFQLLEAVGLKGKENLYPEQLSGGEAQRVSIARAIANDPVIVIADEPTGNLDFRTSLGILDLLEEIRKTFNTTIIVATHDMEIVSNGGGHVIELKDGKLIRDINK